MYKDCHVHTKISHDGISTAKDYIAIAPKKVLMKLLLQNTTIFTMD